MIVGCWIVIGAVFVPKVLVLVHLLRGGRIDDHIGSVPSNTNHDTRSSRDSDTNRSMKKSGKKNTQVDIAKAVGLYLQSLTQLQTDYDTCQAACKVCIHICNTCTS